MQWGRRHWGRTGAGTRACDHASTVACIGFNEGRTETCIGVSTETLTGVGTVACTGGGTGACSGVGTGTCSGVGTGTCTWFRVACCGAGTGMRNEPNRCCTGARLTTQSCTRVRLLIGVCTRPRVIAGSRSRIWLVLQGYTTLEQQKHGACTTVMNDFESLVTLPSALGCCHLVKCVYTLNTDNMHPYDWYSSHHHRTTWHHCLMTTTMHEHLCLQSYLNSTWVLAAAAWLLVRRGGDGVIKSIWC